MCAELGSCYECGVSCVDSATASDSLFDLEADPREETNLVDVYPEVIIVGPTAVSVAILYVFLALDL